MCNFRAEIDAVDAPLDQLEADGLIRRSGNSIEVPEEARPLVRAVAAVFDAYLPKSEARHVAAV
jgi:oxygen-independent coproporphyrinogen-3 oxidase